ncbi:hypothetical protein BDY19DRAFT_900350, partial [Irpex rosettiformis]
WRYSGRKLDKPPRVTDVEEFGKAWREWWQSMQPAWRTTSWPPQNTSAGDAGSWDVLNRGGPCAVYLVLICLRWWWMKVGVGGQDDSDLRIAVKDVSWVLSAIPESLLKLSGKPASANSNGSAKRKRAT